MQRIPFVLELKVFELLFLYALHQNLEELQLLVEMSTRQRVLLAHMPFYHVCPFHRLFFYQSANLQSYKRPDITARSFHTAVGHGFNAKMIAKIEGHSVLTFMSRLSTTLFDRCQCAVCTRLMLCFISNDPVLYGIRDVDTR